MGSLLTSITYFAIALMFGLASATVALDSGRSARVWFVTGAFAGPLALLIVLLGDKQRTLST